MYCIEKFCIMKVMVSMVNVFSSRVSWVKVVGCVIVI